MPANPKLFVSDKVYFVTSRMQEGLPLVPNTFINTIIWSVIGRAYWHYPVEVTAFLFQRNHFHLMLVAKDTETVSRFIKYLKQELSHAVNRMLGRRKRTVWEDGYDSPIVLTEFDTFRYLVYLYTNPVKDKLVDSINDYPGVSSWEMMTNELSSKETIWVRRPAIPILPDIVDERTSYQLTNQLKTSCPLRQTLVVNPFGWKRCFRSCKELSEIHLKEKLIGLVREEEQRLRQDRARLGHQVIGAKELVNQSIRQTYSPENFGRRTICLCHDIPLRIEFLQWFKSLVVKARDAAEKLLSTGLLEDFPPGMFPPRGHTPASWLATAFVT